MATDRPPDRPHGNPYGLMVVGSEIVSFVLVGLLLDYLFKTLPWFTVVLTILGFAAAFTHLVRMARDLGKPPANRQDGRTGGPT
jgi:F0F1-type ATP synthase assembly protein I